MIRWCCESGWRFTKACVFSEQNSVCDRKKYSRTIIFESLKTFCPVCSFKFDLWLTPCMGVYAVQPSIKYFYLMGAYRRIRCTACNLLSYAKLICCKENRSNRQPLSRASWWVMLVLTRYELYQRALCPKVLPRCLNLNCQQRWWYV